MILLPAIYLNYFTRTRVALDYLFSKFILSAGLDFFKLLIVVLVIDGLLLDDEPLWEPLE